MYSESVLNFILIKNIQKYFENIFISFIILIFFLYLSQI